jgi:hypothetical protein
MTRRRRKPIETNMEELKNDISQIIDFRLGISTGLDVIIFSLATNLEASPTEAKIYPPRVTSSTYEQIPSYRPNDLLALSRRNSCSNIQKNYITKEMGL